MAIRGRHALTFVAAATLTSFLVGCSGQDEASSDAELTWDDSPLAKAMGYDSDDLLLPDPASVDSSFEEYSRQTETIIASCMADLGFEYIPSSGSQVQVVVESAEILQDPIENAHQNGYGIGEQSIDLDDVPVNPNQAITDAMSETELAAYERALWGSPFDQETTGDSTIEETEYDWEEAGCSGKAEHEVAAAGSAEDPTTAVMKDPQWAELIAAMNGLTVEAGNDPRMAELNASWSTCMSKAGFDFASPEAAVNSFLDAQDSPAEPAAGDGGTAGAPEDVDAAKDLQINVAVADFTCQEEVDLPNEALRIQFAIEQEFVDANAAELKAFSVALEAAGN